MAAGAIATVLIRLIGKHGITRGIKMAQKLGFNNKSIKQAFKSINKKQKELGLKKFKRKPKSSTFDQRKADRMYSNQAKPSDWRRDNPFMEINEKTPF
tara:strand:- start:435 stop:728 length:294 start_codon:yes stop_codon:yes gene_type:complete